VADVEAVGVVRGGRPEPVDDDWDQVEARIVLDDRFGAEALAGLDEFSHVEVVYRFHLVAPDAEERGARHPRGREDWPEVGIFAQRAKARPNRIGVSTCRLLGVEGTELRVRGLDAVDGTPVLDVKPYMAEFGPRGEVRQPPWSHALMAGYWGEPDGSHQRVAALVATFADRLERRDWEGFRKVLHPDVVYELPQTRERIRGRDSYVTFNTEYPGKWHITPQIVLGDHQDGALLFEWTVDGGEPSLAVAFFEAEDNLITKVTDFWPEPYDPPPGREHLVERW
jgi:tRNA-Thr(GGU) m(6)t(6)A37 methyltransferase TsaA